MIRILPDLVKAAYRNPFAGTTTAGFGTELEGQCLCGLIRNHLASIQPALSGRVPKLFEIGTFEGAGLCHFHEMAPELELHSMNVLAEHLPALPRLLKDEILPKESVGGLAREASVPFTQYYANSRTFDWQNLATQHRFDIVFIDGSHEQLTVLADTLHALQIVKPGGLIVWHDYKVIDGPGRQVFAAINDLDENEFAGQIHHIEGTWLAFAYAPIDGVVPSTPYRRAIIPAQSLAARPAPARCSTAEEAISWHLAQTRRARFAAKVRHLPMRPKVLFFADHRNPVWPPAEETCGTEGQYEVTRDPTQLHQADIVVFHLPSVPSWAKLPRRDSQIWVGVTMEPDHLHPAQASPSNLDTLDLLVSYHAHAEVQANYTPPGALKQALRPRPEKDPDKLVCAFISNPYSHSGRELLIPHLEKLLPIHHYGSWHHNQGGNRPVGREGKLEVLRQYQFCLAFENSIEPDYVTEKWFDCFQTGCVPIYLGAPNIAEYAPGPGSYLHLTVDRSISELARTIQSTCLQSGKYDSYFQWKLSPASEFAELFADKPRRLLAQIDHTVILAREHNFFQ